LLLRRHLLELAAFTAGASAAVAFLFREAFLKGYVLGQAELMFQYLPWLGHRPVGWRAANALLFDVPAVFYPFVAHAREVVRGGGIPLWSAAAGAGEPFLASFQSAIFSPFTAIVYLLPLPLGLTAAAMARLIVGGAGMYLFLRRLDVRPAAAAFGGVAFLLNPFSVVWLEHPLSAVAAWTPWVLLSVETTARRRDALSVSGLAAVTVVLLVSGHPETAVKILMLAGAYALFCCVRSGAPWRASLLIASGVALGTVICAAQILPFLEYVQLSRVAGARAAADGPLFTNPPASFATAFVPNFYGSPLRHRYVLEATNYCEQQAYPALAVWVLAAASLAHRRLRGEVALFLAAALAAGLIMYGTWVARVAIAALPPLRLAALSRFGFIVITGLVIAAAIGLDEILRRATDRAGTATAAMCTAAAAAVALIVGGFLLQQHQMLVDTRQWPVTIDTVRDCAVFLVAAVVLAWAARAIGPSTAGAAAVVLVTIELMTFARGFHPLSPPERSFPPMPEIDVIRRDPGLFRVAGWTDALPPNTAMMYGLQDFRVYDGMGVARYSNLLNVGFRFSGLAHQVVNVATPQLLDLLNVKYLLTPADIDLPAARFKRIHDGPTRVYENLAVQPRAFLVDAFTVTSDTVALRMIRDGAVDLTRTVLLDRAPAREDWPEPAAAPGRASVAGYEDERVEIVTEADGRRLLVLTDIYYPGWQATIDGAQVPILCANGAFRAVAVPAGRHTVRFAYQPASFRYGLIVSGASLLGFALLIGRGVYR
jgi:hypothetical protein